jgi:hypothetical protein
MWPAMLAPAEWPIPFFQMPLLSKDPQEEEKDTSGPEEPAEGAHQPMADQNNEQQRGTRLCDRWDG